jgi:hypothetical protein
MLIEKFEEHGGTWVQQWNPSVQFAVIESDLTYQDLLKFLKLDRIPVSRRTAI